MVETVTSMLCVMAVYRLLQILLLYIQEIRLEMTSDTDG